MIKYLSINIIAELVCLLAACFYLFKDKQAGWRSMTVFLFCTCATEVAGKLMRESGKNNDWLYNLYIIAEMGFTTYLFITLISKYNKSKLLYRIPVFLFIISYIIELVRHGPGEFHNITTSVSSVFFICYGLYYFYLLISDHTDINLSTYAPFWWVTGTLCFFYCSSVSELYFAIFKSRNQHLFTYRNVVYTCLNLILYGCWTYSFICRYQQRRSIR